MINYSILFKQTLKIILISVSISFLQACVSTTPLLDAQIGSALMQAKSAQSLPPSERFNKEVDLQGAGLPSATESLLGLSGHNAGRSAPSALSVK